MSRRALMMTRDPKSNQSYGIIADYLMRMTRQNYEWHIIINERSYGKPKDMDYYWEWAAGRSVQERNSQTMPDLVGNLKPNFIMTIDDLDSVGNVNAFKHNDLPWIQYFPIDNHDVSVLYNTAQQIKASDISITMSKFGFDLARKHNIYIDKYIYPFIDTDAYRKFKKPELQEEVVNFRRSTGLEDKKVLLFVGRPGWRKNIEFLVGAFKKLLAKRDDIALFIHMDFNDPCAEFNIYKLLYSYDIPQELICRFVGFKWHTGIPKWVKKTPKRDMALLYNIADIYVSTHGGEGFGLPAAEAMATEVPGVMTDCTTTPELYQDEDGEWVRGFGAKIKQEARDHNVMRPFVDINDFVDKVNVLLDDESLRKEMGKKGRAWVQKKCSIPVITRKWKRLFNKIDVKKARVIG